MGSALGQGRDIVILARSYRHSCVRRRKMIRRKMRYFGDIFGLNRTWDPYPFKATLLECLNALN